MVTPGGYTYLLHCLLDLYGDTVAYVEDGIHTIAHILWMGSTLFCLLLCNKQNNNTRHI